MNEKANSIDAPKNVQAVPPSRPIIKVTESATASAHSPSVNQTRPKPRYHPPGVPKEYETIDSILLTEPRIEAVRHELQALLKLVQLEANGKPIEADGFRLRNISQWADYPSSLSDIFWHLSSVCNFDCEFCYEKGNPDGFPIQNLPRMATVEEIDTRLKYYDPQTRKGVFTVRTAINEPFVNRQAVNILRRMREKSPNELISFVTNGSYLTEEVVRSLGALSPLFFNLSIYSTDEQIRANVLRDRRPGKAVEAVRLLREYEIPFMSNLVMWPSIPLSDMERTIEFMNTHNASVLRICLGGYSRFLEGDFQRFEVNEYWPEVVERVNQLRDKYEIPLLIEPSSFVTKDTEACIEGVIVESPAHLAGLRRGDKVVSVNGKHINSRMQLLSELRQPTSGTREQFRPPGVVGMTTVAAEIRDEHVVLMISRQGSTFEVSLQRYDPRAMLTYPYRQIAQFNDFVFGLVITDCLRYSSLLQARQLMEHYDATDVLVLTSVMIEPILTYMCQASHAFENRKVTVRVAKNEYFGGSINIGDLLVVDDFIHAIQQFVSAEGRSPDLVLIPNSPFASSPWGRDLTGRPWSDIERVAEVPVEVVGCSNITF